jgi:hypothetical protein
MWLLERTAAFLFGAVLLAPALVAQAGPASNSAQGLSDCAGKARNARGSKVGHLDDGCRQLGYQVRLLRGAKSRRYPRQLLHGCCEVYGAGEGGDLLVSELPSVLHPTHVARIAP